MFSWPRLVALTYTLYSSSIGITKFLVVALDSPECVSTEAKPKPPPQALAMDIALGNWKVQAFRSFIKIGLADAMEKLCANGSYAGADEIALELNLDPVATFRLLRFLSTMDVCIEGENKKFTLGPVGEVVTTSHPQSVAAAVLLETSDEHAQLWSKMDEFLSTNKSQVENVFGNPSYWEMARSNSKFLETFMKAMSGYSNEEAFYLSNSKISPTFDLNGNKIICDLGCAQGGLSKALSSRFGDATYILADLPEVIEALYLPKNFKKESCNFLKDPVPFADAYLLKHIIHDWWDEASIHILSNIKTVNPNAKVFIIEFGPMPGPNIPHLSKGFDLHMGIAVGGIERTQNEYDILFEASGFSRTATHFLAGGDIPLYVQEIQVKDL